MRRIEKCSEIVERPKVWINVEIIGDVVSVIPQRRRIEGEEPNGGNAELLEIIQLFHQAAEVAHPVAVAVAQTPPRNHPIWINSAKSACFKTGGRKPRYGLRDPMTSSGFLFSFI